MYSFDQVFPGTDIELQGTQMYSKGTNAASLIRPKPSFTSTTVPWTPWWAKIDWTTWALIAVAAILIYDLVCEFVLPYLRQFICTCDKDSRHVTFEEECDSESDISSEGSVESEQSAQGHSGEEDAEEHTGDEHTCDEHSGEEDVEASEDAKVLPTFKDKVNA